MCPEQLEPRPAAAWTSAPAGSAAPVRYAGGRRRPDGTFGTPRRYSLGTIFVVTGCFAALLGIVHALGAHPAITGAIVSLLLVVGVAQAVLFGGRRPRKASLIAGGVWGALVGVVLLFYFAIVNDAAFARAARDVASAGFAALACWLLAAIVLGYLAGGVVAGVFLVMDAIEARFFRPRDASQSTADPLD